MLFTLKLFKVLQHLQFFFLLILNITRNLRSYFAVFAGFYKMKKHTQTHTHNMQHMSPLNQLNYI